MRVALFLLCSVLSHAVAQLSLPDPPFLPPNASSGMERSPTSSSPNPQWTTFLGNLLYFYEAQRSGQLPETNRVDWRNSSCLDDGEDVDLDLSGGYYDAGNYIKATFPLSFTLMSICWGALDFGQGYNKANQTVYLDDMLRWGLDWLMKAHPSNSTLYVQIAEADADNSYWGGDRDIPTPRPSYQINPTAPGTDAAAGASAAFSACAALYSNGTSFNSTYYSSPASLQNDSYAVTLLRHAQELYSFATDAEGGQETYQTSVPEVSEAYPSSSYGDELAIAALFLGFASGNDSASFYGDAEKYYDEFRLKGQDAVFNWDSKTPGVSVLFAQIAASDADRADNLSTWRDEAERYFDRIVNEEGPGYLTSGGLLWYDGDSDSASLNPALNAAMLMMRYAPLASSDVKRESYLNFAQSQLDYSLGNNPMSAPYVVGSNPNSPSNPHSAPASGGNDIGKIDTDPEEETYVLYGAVVGGPDKRDRFFDMRSDWAQSEVALDYNAPLLTLAAMHVMNDTAEDPYFTSLGEGEYEKRRPHGEPCDAAITTGCAGPQLSMEGNIVLGVCIGVVGLVIVGLLVIYVWKVKQNVKG